METCIIAIDPGREKCGLAVVDRHQGVREKKIIATQDLETAVKQLTESYATYTVIIGDRTHSRALRKELQAVQVQGNTLTVIPVNEHRSSDEARTRYWQEHPPKGLKKLIPVTLQSPPVPIDDYVAVILAERYYTSL